MCYPGSSALVAVRTSDPGDRFIWFSSFEVWWYFVLGFLCKSSGQFCFGDCFKLAIKAIGSVGFFL